MQPADLVDQIVTNDILNYLEHMVKPGGGYYIDPRTGKITRIMDALDPFGPWVHMHYDESRQCIPHHVFFNAFRAIPTRCLECWKVVVAPRNVVELFDLHDLMRELKFECKCGIEGRPFVNRLYGGYFYANSKNDVLKRYKEVREAVSDVLSPDMPVIAKRYCTEFELQKGPSKAYHQPKDTKHWEKLFWEVVAEEDYNQPVPEAIVIHTKRKWIELAWSAGDKTVLDINGGVPLYTPSQTYHEEEK